MSDEPHAANAVRPIVYSFGRTLTLEDLPKPGQRWIPRRKAIAVAAVWRGLITAEALCARYDISLEEFLGWQKLVARHGLGGLKVTRIPQYRADTRPPLDPTETPTPAEGGDARRRVRR